MTKRYCNNCNSRQESWADHPNYNSSEIFAREERCWSCNRWTLSREMTEVAPPASLSTLLNPFAIPFLPMTGINYLSQIFQGKDLEDYIQRRIDISGAITDVTPFRTWWSKNVGTVINGNYSYTLWLVVYEPSQNDGKIREVLEKFEISNGYDRYSLDSVKNKGSNLRNEVDGNNPILYVHPQASNYVSFSEIVKSPYVIEVSIPYELETTTDYVPVPFGTGNFFGMAPAIMPVVSSKKIPNKNPENYLKPLDVVWAKKRTAGNDYYHVGVYLGNERVCHYSGDDKKQYKAKLIITSWESFVKECIDGEVFGYHSVIPFKHYREIAQQIDWAERNYYWEGKYCLANNNCEHRANSLVYGVDFSRQVWDRPNASINNCRNYRDECRGDCKRRIANNNKSSINLSNEINQTSNQLNKSSGYWYDRIKDEYEAKVVVPPKDCKIM